MKRQTILPFKLEMTIDMITPHAGLALLGEYQIAGKIVFHGGQVFLKVRRGLCRLFTDIRPRIWEFATT
jgi:hypothetical protein